MALACEDSRMSLDGSDLSNLSPCKPIATNNNKTTSPQSTGDKKSQQPSSLGSSPERRRFHVPEEQAKVDKPKVHIEVTRLSWVDIVEEAEQASLSKSQQTKPNKEESNATTTSELVGSESKMSMDDSNSNMSMRSTGSGRQIEIDILDSVNVEKYEKLVRDEKIKSPFKRRLSGDEAEDGELNDGGNDGHAKFVEAECDGPQQPQQHNLHKKTKMNEEDHGRERFRRESSSSSSGDGSSQSSRKPMEYEKDLSILERRQKQIDYGKNTLGYENYMKQVPRDKRTKDHPKTPPKHFKYSRRAWDGLVKVWRKQLHCFDPDAKPDADTKSDA